MSALVNDRSAVLFANSIKPITLSWLGRRTTVMQLLYDIGHQRTGLWFGEAGGVLSVGSDMFSTKGDFS